MFKRLVSCQGYFANIVTSQITTTDRVSTCWAFGHVSCDEGIVPRLVLDANGLLRNKLDYTFSPFAKQMQVG